MRFTVISDCHTKFNNLIIRETDVLISAGDYSFRGDFREVQKFHDWLNRQPAKYKISVQGNHEKGVESGFDLAKQLAESVCPGVFFIDEGLVEIEGIKIWCSAITPFFYNWAWNRFPGDEIQKHWDKIPKCDILVTHGPPHGILDKLDDRGSEPGKHVGCPQLLEKVKEIKPVYHIFGHIHEGRGVHVTEHTTFINASVLDSEYKPYYQENFTFEYPLHKTT